MIARSPPEDRHMLTRKALSLSASLSCLALLAFAVARSASADHNEHAGVAEENAGHGQAEAHGAAHHSAMDHSAMDHAAMDHGVNPDEHAAHREMMTSADVRISTAHYAVPNVTLFDQHNTATELQSLLADGRPLAVNFIFTTCTTICPVMTATWVQLEAELASEPSRPHMVSISIDPAYDTPEALNAYADLFGASWTFLTGRDGDIARTLDVFDASRGSKVNHFALTLMRPADSDSWTRVEGLTSARALAQVWRDLNP